MKRLSPCLSACVVKPSSAEVLLRLDGRDHFGDYIELQLARLSLLPLAVLAHAPLDHLGGQRLRATY